MELTRAMIDFRKKKMKTLTELCPMNNVASGPFLCYNSVETMQSYFLHEYYIRLDRYFAQYKIYSRERRRGSEEQPMMKSKA